MAKSFAGPFVVTFAIAVFVLMMQVLWLYLDDIAGKGLGFFTVIELMSYKCVGLVPLALPLALLISSVMVLGGMAEHYELSSFKSAGVSLLRVMRTLIIFGVISSAVSFSIADYVIPAANLQFGARMYDIQQKKPTLNMEPGVFNEDFNQFAIRLGGREEDGRNISDVLIYDHTKAATGELGQITANTGEMYSADDGRLFVMKLYDGVQYSEQRPGGKNGESRPFVRTSFKSYTKVFDLSEFNLGVTNRKLFSTNRSMLATWQLQIGVDSIDTDIAIRKQTISNHMVNYLPMLKKDTITYREKPPEVEDDPDKYGTRPDDESENEAAARRDSSRRAANASVARGTTIQRVSTRAETEEKPEVEDRSPVILKDRRTEAREKALAHPLVTGAENWNGINSLIDSVSTTVSDRMMNRARSAVRSISGQAKAAERILPGIRESRVKHIYDLHMKYSMALVCIIFIFIGAPMGAIVRKGGFGYPILVSIIFFVIFIILTIFCRKLAESFVVDAAVAGWLPCIILFPVSLYITTRAMKDAKLVNLDGIKSAFSKLFSKISSKSEA
ncbi:YjgP/YjgQ family permease [Neolewinella aurantiaca]|uniref:YjgP/YjgQ family permease n=1 Tax=Neolewinella aurantiaca TaxID=2602767 RepID=A0A5C7FSP1_9BACT|nr:LptF/LptG family permease [Neolewinella aurantiaca]TXF88428.1 YjgP/YjgQ family permease [Neolewinella aurantiaca]